MYTMIRLLLLVLAGASACQWLDDATYRPRIGPVVPDAMPPPDAAVNGTCTVVPGDTCGDSDLTATVSFSRDIQPMLVSTMPGGCMKHTLMQAPGVMFDPSTYESLRSGGKYSQRNIIINCDPCRSILVQKLSALPPYGTRMPMDPPYWTDDEMTKLRDWIAEGAQDN